jgi:hypothetical protein
MRVQFVVRENAPRVFDRAEVYFEGALTGVRLVGSCLWKSPDGEST